MQSQRRFRELTAQSNKMAVFALIQNLRSVCCDHRMLKPNMHKALLHGEDVVSKIGIKAKLHECSLCDELLMPGDDAVRTASGDDECDHTFHRACMARVLYSTEPGCSGWKQAFKEGAFEEFIIEHDGDDELQVQ